MNPQLIHLGSAFYIAAGVLGVPAIVFLVIDGVRRLRAKLTPKVDSSFPVKNPDAILLMLGGIIKGVGAIARVMGFVGSILANVLAVVSVGALGLSIILFLTARGLQAGETWARVVAGLLMSLVFLIALAAIASSSTRRGFRWVIPLLILIVSGFAVRIVWNG